MITIEKIWLTADAVWIRTTDGREACEYFADYPRLRFATPEQRANYKADAFGINWPGIDEDLSFEGFFQQKKCTAEPSIFVAKIFKHFNIIFNYILCNCMDFVYSTYQNFFCRTARQPSLCYCQRTLKR